MRKKNGFTLVELLVVIALMAVITTSISVAVFKMLSDQRDNISEAEIDNIETAACVYAEVYNLRDSCNSSVCEISISIKDDLIPLGYLDNEDYDNDNVTVSWDSNGLKTCTYSDDEGEN